MAARWSTVSVSALSMSLAGPGEEIGEDVVPEGQVALVLGADGENIAVIGTLDELRAKAWDGLVLALPEGV